MWDYNADFLPEKSEKSCLYLGVVSSLNKCYILVKCSIFSIDSFKFEILSMNILSLAFKGIFLLINVSLCKKHYYPSCYLSKESSSSS